MRTTWLYDSGLCKELGRADMRKVVNHRHADLETNRAVIPRYRQED